MDRRRLLILSAALAVAPGAAVADAAGIPLKKAFPLLAIYLGLPPAERSRFYLAYRAVRDMRPDPGAQALIVAANGARWPIAVDHTALVLALPTLALLRSGAVMLSSDPALKLIPELRPSIAPSARVDVSELALALAQVNAAIAKIAGPLALAAPKLDCAFFPDSGGGRVVAADGRSAPLQVYSLPAIGPAPYLVPARLAGAQVVVLTRPPSRILLGAHPKGT